jgi:hypothetical protein
MRGSRAGLLMAVLAMSSAAAPWLAFAIQRRDELLETREGPISTDTVNTGRRAEKDAAALAKAESKRARKAAKRAADASYNAELKGGASAPSALSAVLGAEVEK